MLYIGIIAMLTQFLFPSSNTVLTCIAAELGEMTIAAFEVGTRIESVTMIESMALSSVIIPFIDRNYGANYFDRIKIASRFILCFAMI